MAATSGKPEASTKPAGSGPGNAIVAGGRFEGIFHFTGPVIISAHVRGDVVSDDLILVEAAGRIEGRIRAATLIVRGAVCGDIEASKSLEVCAGGRLEGVAFSPSMRVGERTVVSADLLIAPERSAAHLNKGASLADLSNLAPQAPGRPDTQRAGPGAPDAAAL